MPRIQPLSPEVRQALEALQEPGCSLRLAFGGQCDWTFLLEKVAASGEVRAVFSLAPLLEGAAFRRVLAAIERLLAGQDSRTLLALENLKAWKESSYSTGANQWPLRPSGVEGLAGSVWALALASLHPSGYVREAAVRQLAYKAEWPALAFLLLRTNDWVPEVSGLALGVCRQRLSFWPVSAFAEALPFVDHLETCVRGDSTALVSDVRAALRSEFGLAALRSVSRSKDRFVRRSAYKLALGVEPIAPDLLDAALVDEDPLIRVRAAERLCQGEPVEAWAPRLAGERLAAVRRVAVVQLAKREGMPFEAFFPFALDSNRAVREVARFRLKALGFAGLAELYRQHLGDSGRRLLGAMAGLGEEGGAGDADLVRPLRLHPRVKVRLVAVLALGRLVAEGQHQDFFAALGDRSSKVAAAAADELARRAPGIPVDRILAEFSAPPGPHVRRGLLQVIARKRHWTTARLLLEALALVTEEERGPVLASLDVWLCEANYSYQQVPPEDAARILALLPSLEGLLGRRAIGVKDFLRLRSG
jgi:hypothetical protein